MIMIPELVYNSQFFFHSLGSNIFNASRNGVEGNLAFNLSAKLFAYRVISVKGLRYV